MIRPAPVIGERPWWRGSVGDAGKPAHQYLYLRPGRWNVSLQYDSGTGVTVHAPRLRAGLPPSLEPLGPG